MQGKSTEVVSEKSFFCLAERDERVMRVIFENLPWKFYSILEFKKSSCWCQHKHVYIHKLRPIPPGAG